jgi:hypothetical protein
LGIAWGIRLILYEPDTARSDEMAPAKKKVEDAQTSGGRARKRRSASFTSGEDRLVTDPITS